MSKFLLAAEEATRKAAAKRAEANALADKEGGLSKEEAARFDAMLQEAEGLDAVATENRGRHDRLKANGDALAGYSRPPARVTADPKGEPLVAREGFLEDPRRGFRSSREFLLTAMENRGYRDRSNVKDERLRSLAVFDKDDRMAAGDLAFILPRAFTPPSLLATAGSDEQGGYSDEVGGVLRPTATMNQLLRLGPVQDPTAGRTTQIPMSAPMVEIPACTDKDHTTSVSGGFTVTRRPETVASAASRGLMEKVTLKATSLHGLAFATEEILTDSPISFAGIVQAGFDREFPFAIFKEKVRGGGGNEYLGVLNSPAKIEVAAEGGQTADTVVAENVIKMRARLYGSGVWIANPMLMPQLLQAAIVKEGSVGGGLILVYQASLREGAPDMLLGLPIFYSEIASAPGDVGDIMLVDWSQFLEGTYQPLQSAESMHVRFVEHERAFKFWVRNAGAPWWRAALTPHKGADTLSPIVTLAAR